MTVRPTLLLLALASFSAACDDGFLTEQGQLRIQSVDMVADPVSGMEATSPLLAGDRFCADVKWNDEEGDLAGLCFDQSVGGAASLEEVDGCIAVEEAGAILWGFEPAGCADRAPVADAVALVAVDPAEVAAEIVQWPEDLAESGLEGDFPDDWRNPDGAPFRVVAGSPIRFAAGLRHPDHDALVAWNGADGGVVIDEVAGPAPEYLDGAPGFVAVALGDGTELAVAIEAAGRSWDAGALVGVAVEEAASIELVVGYVPAETEGQRTPLGARAVVRDAAGSLLYGAPVEWTVADGPLRAKPGEGVPGLDYAILEDAKAGTVDGYVERSATLRVSLGDLSDEEEVAWAFEDVLADCFDCAEPVAGGCGCASGSGSGEAVGLGVAGLAFAARRRRARR